MEVLAVAVDSEQAGWVPAEACRLPTADQPLRVAEFDDLFASAVRTAERVDPTRLRLELAPEPTVAARAADLAVRETDCCGFFTFTLTVAEHRLLLEVTVPSGQAAVLDSLAERATVGVRA